MDTPKRSSLVAASVRYGKKRGRINEPISPEEWQQQAWLMYDITGQGRFVANSIANTASRARLYIAEIDPDTGEIEGEADNPALRPYVASPLGTGQRRRENLRQTLLNLFVGGELYIVGEANSDHWFFLSPFDLHSSEFSGGYECQRPQNLGGGTAKLDPDNDIIYRVWTPHPQRHKLPDSPFRAALPDLSILSTIRKRQGAELDSRLSAGLFLVPDEVELPDGLDAFQDRLISAMAEGIKHAASPESLTPIVMQCASEFIENFKKIDFWSDLSDAIGDLEDRKIRGIGQSLDAPVAMMEGGSGSESRWTAWLTAEETITTHYEPLLSRIADAITHVFLKPNLTHAGLDPRRYSYAFDVAALHARVDKLGDTLQLWDRGIVSSATVLAEADLDESNAPSKEETTTRLLREILASNPTLLTADMINAAGLAVPINFDSVALEPVAIEAEPAPAQDERTGNTPMKPPEAAPPDAAGQQPSMVAAGPATTCTHPHHGLHTLASAACFRALEIAGGRLVPHRPRGANRTTLHTSLAEIPTAHKTDKAMHGVWLTLPETLGEGPAEVVQPVLDGYVRSLLATGTAHTPRRLCALLSAIEADHG